MNETATNWDIPIGDDDYDPSWDGRASGPISQPSKPLPHNTTAEAALLGALILQNKLIPEIAQIVTGDDFFSPGHASLFAVIVKLHDRGKVITPITLRPIFESDAEIIRFGGVRYLHQLTSSGAGVIGARDFAAQIADMGAMRRMMEVLQRGLENIREKADLNWSPVEAAASIETDLNASFARQTGTLPKTSGDAVRSVREHIDQVRERGVPLGARNKVLPEIEQALGPAVGGRYNIIGGRPGMGKSTLLQSMAMGYALYGEPVEYFLAEMSELTQSLRYTSDLSHWMGRAIPHDVLVDGSLSQDELRDLAEVETASQLLPISFTTIGREDVRALKGRVQRAKDKWRAKDKVLRVVGIDYIQILAATRNGKLIENETEKVTAISNVLLDIATELDVCVFALSQLSRDIDQRTNKRPMISDLRQSAALENDADSVSFVYREEYYLRKSRAGLTKDADITEWELNMAAAKGRVEFITAKNRHGPEGSRDLKFYGEHYAMRSKHFDPAATRQDDMEAKWA